MILTTENGDSLNRFFCFAFIFHFFSQPHDFVFLIEDSIVFLGAIGEPMKWCQLSNASYEFEYYSYKFQFSILTIFYLISVHM